MTIVIGIQWDRTSEVIYGDTKQLEELQLRFPRRVFNLTPTGVAIAVRAALLQMSQDYRPRVVPRVVVDELATFTDGTAARR
jgi:hypothetical protein